MNAPKPPAGCPIPNTHRRLEQSHRLWHQMLASYPDPDGFVTNLNAAVESLRNVTFMLQNEKASVPDFDSWYSGWQAAMKADRTMKWLSDARTTVVHRADLETYSVAAATIQNNLPLATLTITVPPFLPTEHIAAYVAKTLPSGICTDTTDLILAVERRWCVKDLPGQELLEALARAYGHLSKLVADAHDRVGSPYDTIDGDGDVHRTPDGRMPCMLTTKEMRTVLLRLDTGGTLIPRFSPLSSDPADLEKSAKRYDIPPDAHSSEPSKDPFTLADAMLELAKKMLRKDKYLVRTVFLLTGNRVHAMGLKARDRADKFALMRTVAEEVRKTQADALIDIGEVWTSSLSELQAGRMPEVAQDRGEAISVTVLTREGRCRTSTTVFRRNFWGAIKIEDTEVAEASPPTYLAPVLAVWNLPPPRFDFGVKGPG